MYESVRRRESCCLNHFCSKNQKDILKRFRAILSNKKSTSEFFSPLDMAVLRDIHHFDWIMNLFYLFLLFSCGVERTLERYRANTIYLTSRNNLNRLTF